MAGFAFGHPLAVKALLQSGAWHINELADAAQAQAFENNNGIGREA